MHIHGGGYASVKDIESALDISDSCWDQFFEEVMNRPCRIFFHGNRPNYMSKETEMLMTSFAIWYDGWEAFGEVNAGNLLLSRKGMSSIWRYFDSPLLLFAGKDAEKEVVDAAVAFKSKLPVEKMLLKVGGGVCFYGGFEPDVLWIQKTASVELSFWD